MSCTGIWSHLWFQIPSEDPTTEDILLLLFSLFPVFTLTSFSGHADPENLSGMAALLHENQLESLDDDL